MRDFMEKGIEKIKEDNIKKGVLVGYLEAFASNNNILGPMSKKEFHQFFVHFAFLIGPSFGVGLHKALFKDLEIDDINKFLKFNNFPYEIKEQFNEETESNEYRVVSDGSNDFKHIDSIFKPYIVTLVGSRKFIKEFNRIENKLTMEGKLVFTPSIFKVQKPLEELSEEEHEYHDRCHREKIKMSNEVFVINTGGYIGNDTLEEIEFAKDLKIKVNYLEKLEIAFNITEHYGPLGVEYYVPEFHNINCKNYKPREQKRMEENK